MTAKNSMNVAVTILVLGVLGTFCAGGDNDWRDADEVLFCRKTTATLTSTSDVHWYFVVITEKGGDIVKCCG